MSVAYGPLSQINVCMVQFSLSQERLVTSSTLKVSLFNVSSEFNIAKFGLAKLEASLYRMAQSIFRYLEPLRRDS